MWKSIYYNPPPVHIPNILPLIHLDPPVNFTKPMFPACFQARYRHTCTPIPIQGKDCDSANLLVIGGTGKTRESTFGDIGVFGLEKQAKDSRSEIFSPLLWRKLTGKK